MYVCMRCIVVVLCVVWRMVYLYMCMVWFIMGEVVWCNDMKSVCHQGH